MDDFMHIDKRVKLEVDVSNDSSHDALHVDVNSSNSDIDPIHYHDNDFLSQKYLMSDNKEYVLTDSTNGHYNGVNSFASKFNSYNNNNNNNSNPKPSEALFIHALLSRCKRLAPLWFKGALSMREKNRKEHKRGYTVSGVQTSSSWSAVLDKITEMSCRAETEMVMNLLKKLYKELASDSIIWFIKCWLRLPETRGENYYSCVLSRGDARGRMRRIDGGKGSDKVWRLDTIVSMLYHGMPMSSTDTNIIVHTCDQELCVRPQHLRFRASAVALAVVLKALQQGGYQLIPPKKVTKDKDNEKPESADTENGQEPNSNRSGSASSVISGTQNQDEVENSVEISGPFNIEQIQQYLIQDLKPCVQSLEKMVLSATDRSILCANPDLDNINNITAISSTYDSPRTIVNDNSLQYKAFHFEKSNNSRPMKRLNNHLVGDCKSPNSIKRGRLLDRKNGSKSPPLLMTDITPVTSGYLKNASVPIPTMNTKSNSNNINPHLNGCNLNGINRSDPHSITNSFPNFYHNHAPNHNPSNHHPSMNLCSPNPNPRYMYQNLGNHKSNPFHHNLHHPFIPGTGSHTFPPLFPSSSNIPDPGNSIKHHHRFSPLSSPRHGSMDHLPLSLTPTKNNRHGHNSNIIHPVSVPYYPSSQTPSIFPFRHNPFESMPPLGFSRFQSPKKPHFNNIHRPIPEPATTCAMPKLGNSNIQPNFEEDTPLIDESLPNESFSKRSNEIEKNPSPIEEDSVNASSSVPENSNTSTTTTSRKSNNVTPSQTPRKPAKKRLEARTPTFDKNDENQGNSSLDFSASTGSAFRLVHKSKSINTTGNLDNATLSNITDSIKVELGTDDTELSNILTERSKVDKVLSKKVNELSGQLLLQKHQRDKANENKCSGSAALLHPRNSDSAQSGHNKEQSSHSCVCLGNEDDCPSANGYPGNCCSSAASRTSVKSYSANAPDGEMFVPFNFVFSGVSRSTPNNQTTPCEPKSCENDSVNGVCARFMGSLNQDRLNSGQAHMLLNAIRNSPISANCTELLDLLSSMVQQYGIASGSNINNSVDHGSSEQTRSESRILAHIYQRLYKTSPSDRPANQLLQKNYSFSPLSTEVDLNYLRAAAVAHHNGSFNKNKSRLSTRFNDHHHIKTNLPTSRSDSCASFDTNHLDSINGNRSRYHSSDNPPTTESTQPVTVSTISATPPDNGPVSSCSAFSVTDTHFDSDNSQKKFNMV